jgi:tetratricopeptide (TPR) repeat protein
MTQPALATRRPDSNAGSQAAQQLHIGLEHYAAGRLEGAIAAYQHGLAVTEQESPGCTSIATVSELYSNLGNACMVHGDLETAAASYKAALRLAPQLTSCWCNLGNVQLRAGKPHEAIALYGQALTLNPGHWPSRTNLVHALTATQQYLLAKMLLAELVDERPQDAELRNQLGKLHFELNELDAALECFRQAVAVNPRDSNSLNWIGGIKQQMGDIEGAEAAYAEAARIDPVIRRPANNSPADFRVLALFAPFAGNIPTDYLFKDAAYDVDTVALFESGKYDVDVLTQSVQVVINLISDADQAGAVLPLATDLIRGLRRPTINDPRKLQKTTRDALAERLRGIPGCCVPKVVRQRAGSDLTVATLRASLPLASSILTRPAGTHGGDDFEKIDDPADLTGLLAQRADSDRYFIEYIDYRSSDGHFRKYRFIFVDDEILPYHLAIADHWKVHHDSTDMVNHQWMQREEQEFLSNPATVFNPGHFQVLRDIRQRIGLDFFGIDCGLNRAGELVVFEVNASMLVHEHNEKFPYKAPFVLRIKSAFDEMLRRFASAEHGVRMD